MIAGAIVDVNDLTRFLQGDPVLLTDAATAAVRAYCGWHITPVIAETITVRSDGASCQVLPSLHVTDIASVTYDGTLLAAADFTWRQIGILDFTGSGPYFSVLPAWSRTGDIQVSYTHGYDTALEVGAVILSVAARAQVSPDGVTRSQVGQVSQSFSQTGTNQAGGIAFLPSELAILDRYRLRPRP